MKKNLCKRGYTKRSIDNELKKVDKLDRNNLLQYRTDKCKTDRVPLVLTYSKGLPHVCEIIKKKMTVLHKSEKMKKGFLKQPILALTRDKNLKDILVHKKHNSMFLSRNISVNLAVGTELFVRMFVAPIRSQILKEKYLK